MPGSEDELRDLVENAPVGIHSVAPDGTILWANRTELEMLGYQPNEYIGQDIRLFHVDREVIARVLELLRGGQPVHNQSARLRARDGSIRHVLISSNVLRRDGEFVHTRCFTRDVSGQVRAAEELRLREEQFRTLLANTPDIVSRFGPDCRFQYVNPAVAEHTGQPPGRYIGRTHAEAGVPRDLADRLERELRSVFATGQRRTVEFRMAAQDGQARHYMGIGVPELDESGHVRSVLTIVRDVTRAKQAEAALQEQKAVLELIATGSPLPQVLTAVCLALEARIAGSFASILLLRAGTGRLHVEVAPRLPRAHADALREGVPVGPDCGSCGTAAWFKRPVTVTDIASDPLWRQWKDAAVAAGLRACWSRPVFSEAGEVLGTFCVYHSEARGPNPVETDQILGWMHIAGIAIRRQSVEEELRSSRERLQVAQSAARAGLWDWQTETGQVVWSPEYFELYGYEPATVTPSFETWLASVHPDDRERAHADALRSVRQNVPYASEFRILRGEEIRWIYAAGSRIAEASGRPARMIGLAFDITARKQAEEALRESEERLRLAQKAAGLGIQDWNLRSARQAWTREVWALAGLHPDAVEPAWEAWLELVHLEDRSRLETSVRDALTGSGEFSAEYRIVQPSGETRWLLSRGAALRDAAGQLERLLSVVFDFTARKTAEEQLRRANDDLEHFAYAASHDLREPARIVTVFSQLLERHYAAVLDERGRMFLSRLLRGSDQMRTLLENMLAYSRLNAAPLDETPVAEAAAALHDALSILAPSVSETGAQVMAGDLPAVRAHNLHLVQIFQNLIGNAVKFRAVEPPRVLISAADAGRFVRFSVSDNGIGIDPRYHDQVFGLFKRLHNNERYQGSGLGLAICQKLVNRYGGAIGVESQPGEGATFWFTLPKAEPSVKVAHT